MSKTICHCNVKENAELIAKIMDYDVDGKVCSEITEVVRCKDCKYREKSSHSDRRDYCGKHSTWEYIDYVNPTDYCSKGERKKTDE